MCLARIRPFTPVVCVIAGLLAVPAAAAAEERSGGVGDFRDQPENPSGPNMPDIAGAGVIYDSAGTLTLRVVLHEPVQQTQPGYSFQIRVGSSYADGSGSAPWGTCLTDRAGDVSLNGSIDPASSTP